MRGLSLGSPFPACTLLQFLLLPGLIIRRSEGCSSCPGLESCLSVCCVFWCTASRSEVVSMKCSVPLINFDLVSVFDQYAWGSGYKCSLYFSFLKIPRAFESSVYPKFTAIPQSAFFFFINCLILIQQTNKNTSSCKTEGKIKVKLSFPPPATWSSTFSPLPARLVVWLWQCVKSSGSTQGW